MTLSTSFLPLAAQRLGVADERDERHLGRFAALLGDVGHGAARVGGMRQIAAEQQAVGRRDLGEHLPGVREVLEVAVREEHGERRMPVKIRVDVGRDVDPLRPRVVEEREQARSLAPERPHGELDVRDLHGELRLPADREDLVDRLPERPVLAADVADVAAAVACGDRARSISSPRVE